MQPQHIASGSRIRFTASKSQVAKTSKERIIEQTQPLSQLSKVFRAACFVCRTRTQSAKTLIRFCSERVEETCSSYVVPARVTGYRVCTFPFSVSWVGPDSDFILLLQTFSYNFWYALLAHLWCDQLATFAFLLLGMLMKTRPCLGGALMRHRGWAEWEMWIFLEV